MDNDTNDPSNELPQPEPTRAMPVTSGAETPVTGAESGSGPTAALIGGGVIAALLLIGLVVFFVTRSSDGDSAEIEVAVTESTTTMIESTTTIDTMPETTTTVAETTTTVVETTTLPETTVAPTTVVLTTAPPAPTPVVAVPPAPETTMWDAIVNSPDLSEFRAAVESAGLVDLLDGPEPVTVLAPSNAAFEAFRAGVGNEAALADLPTLIRHHLASGSLTADDIFAMIAIDTLAGDKIAVDQTARTVDRATLIVVDVRVGGSTLHVVDLVLVAAS